MKYTLEITINAPLKKVFELFDSPKNLKQWQKGFVSFKRISGKPRTVGAKSKIKSKVGIKTIEVTETITKRKIPNEFSAIYETKGVWNDNKNYFKKLNSNKTKWRQKNEFKCSGFLKILQFFMPKIFKNTTQKQMRFFKEFVER